MRPVTDPAPDRLDANAVRAELLAALTPLAGLVEASGVPLDGLRFLIQLDPAALRLVRAACDGAPAVQLGAIGLDALPWGRAIREAVSKLAAGLLSVSDGGEMALDLAHQWRGKGGGFMAVVDPTTGDCQLLLAGPGRDLSEAVVLGAIVDEPGALH